MKILPGPAVRPAMLAGLIVVQSLIAGTLLAPQVMAGTTAECDSLQTDNSWVFRNNSVAISASSPATEVYGTISNANPALCTRGLFTPFQTGSSAWVAVNPGTGGNSIVQIGVDKCNTIGAVCGNNMDAGKVDYFYAYGIDGNPFYMP